MPCRNLFVLGVCLWLAACAGQVLPEDARMADALCDQGKVLLAAGKNESARDVYSSATNRDETNARGWNGLGVADDLLGKRAEAEGALRRAADLAPHDAAIANNLAHFYIETGDNAAAVNVLQPFAADPNAPAALRQNLALAQQGLGKGADDKYADLGSYPTEGMAQGHLREIKSVMGRDAKGLSCTVEPEVKVDGGIPTFTIKATGRPPQDICDDLNAQAFPCVVGGE